MKEDSFSEGIRKRLVSGIIITRMLMCGCGYDVPKNYESIKSEKDIESVEITEYISKKD
jgi:hypothetical protein